MVKLLIRPLSPTHTTQKFVKPLPDNKPKRKPSLSHPSEESMAEVCMPNSGNLLTNTAKLSIRPLLPTLTTQKFVRPLLDNKLKRRPSPSHPLEESTVEVCMPK